MTWGEVQKSWALLDEVYDATVPAFLGIFGILSGPLVAWAVFIHHFPWESPPGIESWTAALVFSVFCVVGGIFACTPWWRARARLRAHLRKVEAAATR